MTPMLGIMASSISGSKISTSSFESIATVTAVGSETVLTFSSIPGTYKHLQIRGIGKTLAANDATAQFNITFNADTATNYDRHFLRGSGASVTANGQVSQSFIGVYGMGVGGLTSNYFAPSITDITDYASTSKYKTLRNFSGNNTNGTTNSVVLNSGLWMSTAAITSIEITNGSLFVGGSTYALYGIKG